MTLDAEGREVHGSDIFGNPFVITKQSDGRLLKRTQSNTASHTGDDTSRTALQYIAEGQTVDIHSGREFPANVLSNLYPSAFTFDGVRLSSMEGFLQSLKTANRKRQQKIHALSGIEAKNAGVSLKRRFDGRRLHWKEQTIDRFSPEYQQLLKQAYQAKFEQDALFRWALAATEGKTLTHSIGKSAPQDTILTENEFISLLNGLRTPNDEP
jgi:predicted NAD-dependent protein-ADP-ribosyltransferase YbiA (DUF1768 family)